ncbi:DUF2339 domain-containing protein [Hazenella sp. IB182357]|uniref:DUF2339 domain-containing protein n=1 Tax=Polycladospora coralii TaxID=2771432 RepID=A0A926NAM1_9BACL|nr:DUF2339 domain-containing protein [Polycladospora coralii]MBD1372567.1 DUF2339 domain-containing protein [Polycladospora coralii]MBS7531310.1 DUF2339 domain-containing protein [Polycladospora coralii]
MKIFSIVLFLLLLYIFIKVFELKKDQKKMDVQIAILKKNVEHQRQLITSLKAEQTNELEYPRHTSQTAEQPSSEKSSEEVVEESEEVVEEVTTVEESEEVVEKVPAVDVKEVSSPKQDKEHSNKKTRTRVDWELLIGGRLLNRIGALALIIGIGYLLKYAFDQNWISEPMRMLMGASLGVGLLLYGSYTHRKGYMIFAQGIMGVAISVLHLSVFISFQYYHLISQAVAMLVMSVITMIAFRYALKYQALAISILAWAGGFLTPFLLSNGDSNPVGLFTYLLFLSGGLLWVVWKKPTWMILYPLTFGATHAIYFIWLTAAYVPETEKAFAMLFSLLFWLCFSTYDLLKRIHAWGISSIVDHTIVCLNAYLLLQSFIMITSVKMNGLFTFGLALIYFIIVYLLKKRLGAFSFIYLVPGITLATVAVPLQFSAYMVAMLWALGALSLILWGVKYFKNDWIWKIALMLFGLALFDFQYVLLSSDQTYAIFFHERTLAFIVIALSLVGGAYTLRKGYRIDVQVVHLIYLTAVCFMTYWQSLEAWNIFINHIQIDSYLNMVYIFTILWMANTILYTWIASRYQIRSILYTGMGIGLFAVICGMSTALLDFSTQSNLVFDMRSITLAILTIGIGIFLALLHQFEKQEVWVKRVQQIGQVIMVVMVFELLTLKVTHLFYHTMPFQTLFDKLPLVLALVWGIYGVILVELSVRKYGKMVRYSGLSILGLAIVVGMITGIHYEPLAQFVVILNLRFLVLAFLLLGISRVMWLLKPDMKKEGWLKHGRLVGQILLMTVVFELITVETFDYFLKEMQGQTGNVYQALAYTRVLLLSSMWGVYAVGLYYLGVKRFGKPVYYGGIGLLSLSVIVGAVWGLSYQPLTAFDLVFNLRFFTLCLLTIGVAGMTWHFSMVSKKDAWMKILKPIGQIVLILLLFEMVTVETRDLYHHTLMLALDTEQNIWLNRMQLALSLGWLSLSILLLTLGLWRRLRIFRMAAMLLFGISILKIFIIDLSFLETLYRIVSFIGLGVVLLGVSFAYQKFKDHLL